MDEPKKIKSIKLPFGKYFKYVWFEELDEFAGEGEIENVLDSAIRGGKAALCVCTYNPPKSANNWVNKWAIDLSLIHIYGRGERWRTQGRAGQA